MRPAFPGASWTEAPIAGSGWSASGLRNLAGALDTGGSTAMMIVESGRVIFQWGDPARRSSTASVRKSLISVLFGMGVHEGRIDLDATLEDLGLDDLDPLSPLEKQASILDLLKARSGVYHPSVYDTEQGRPPRGAHPPGANWFYNNWDFNVLGTIFQQQTGEPLFEAFAMRLAAPLGMEDFTPADGRFQHGPQSIHPVYKLRFSARDLARVGLLYLRGGKWGDQQIVPERWVNDSTRCQTDLGGGRGYGYLWWNAAANAAGDGLGASVPLFYASGYGGQYIIVLPERDLVVVHRAAEVDKGITHERMGELLRLALAAMPERS